MSWAANSPLWRISRLSDINDVLSGWSPILVPHTHTHTQTSNTLFEHLQEEYHFSSAFISFRVGFFLYRSTSPDAQIESWKPNNKNKIRPFFGGVEFVYFCLMSTQKKKKSNNARVLWATGVVVLEFKMCTEKILKQKCVNRKCK